MATSMTSGLPPMSIISICEGHTVIRYSFKEQLAHGPVWDLKRLDSSRNGKNYVPPETRAAFLRVVADCTVSRRASDAI
jgi:hypothetical protein